MKIDEANNSILDPSPTVFEDPADGPVTSGLYDKSDTSARVTDRARRLSALSVPENRWVFLAFCAAASVIAAIAVLAQPVVSCAR